MTTMTEYAIAPPCPAADRLVGRGDGELRACDASRSETTAGRRTSWLLPPARAIGSHACGEPGSSPQRWWPSRRSFCSLAHST